MSTHTTKRWTEPHPYCAEFVKRPENRKPHAGHSVHSPTYGFTEYCPGVCEVEVPPKPARPKRRTRR